MDKSQNSGGKAASNSSFNIAHTLAKTFVESKLVLAIIPAVILFGLMGLFEIPREENPQIVIPAAEVTIPIPGMSPLEVEHLLLTPLENHLNTMQGVKHTYGVAGEGFAKIQVEFKVGEDKTESFVRLYDQVERYKIQLPPLAGEPHIHLMDVDDIPFIVVTLASDKYDRYQLTHMAERMTEHLHSIEGVGLSEIHGGQENEVRVEIDPTRLQALGLGLNQIRAHIQGASIDHSLGFKVIDKDNQHLRISHKLEDLGELKRLVVFRDDDKVVHLQDIAHITTEPDTKNLSLSRFNFGPSDSRYEQYKGEEMAAVHIGIAKQAGINSVPLSEAILERVASMQEQWIPNSVEVVTTRNDGQTADDSVNYLIEHLFIAIAVVSVVLWVFLGWRAASIVFITIPIVFALVIGIDLLAGPTLNRMALYALILALGLLVDDAIVVIENIHRHNQLLPKNSSKEAYSKAIVNAASEIGNPTTLATITVVAVFLSLLFVTGMAGEYFYPIAFNVPAAMIASLLVAYIITPWAARRFLPVTHEEHKEIWLQTYYRSLFKRLSNSSKWRKVFYLGVLVCLLASLLQPSWQFIRSQGVGGELSPMGVNLVFLPKDDKNTFLVTFKLPDDTPLEETDRLVREVAGVVLAHDEVVNTQTFVGGPSVIDFNGQIKGSANNVGSQYAEMRVNLSHKWKRNDTSIEIVQQLRSALADIIGNHPEATVQLLEDPPGPPIRATVLAEIYEQDNEKREATAKELETLFKDTWDMAEVWTSNSTPIQEYNFKIDQRRVLLAGLDVQQVAAALSFFVQGDIVNHLYEKEARNPIPIRLVVPHNQRIVPEILAQTFVKNKEGASIPLSTVIDIVPNEKATPIFHKDNERVSYVGGELVDSAPVYAVLDLEKRIEVLQVDRETKITTRNLGFVPDSPTTLDDTVIHWDGELRLTLDVFRDLGIALAMSLLAIYFLLVAYYQSFSLPLLVMVSIPLGLIGVFPGHWLLDQDFTAPSMIGVIALAGVAVRNSLLIVDFIRERIAEGMSPEEAISDAGALRIIPITLTTLAIVFGTLVIIPDPVMGGLAVSLIFGSISSAILTVLVVPLLYGRKNKY